MGETEEETEKAKKHVSGSALMPHLFPWVTMPRHSPDGPGGWQLPHRGLWKGETSLMSAAERRAIDRTLYNPASILFQSNAAQHRDPGLRGIAYRHTSTDLGPA